MTLMSSVYNGGIKLDPLALAWGPTEALERVGQEIISFRTAQAIE